MLGRDLVGQAQTGTGKTAAFALPIIEKLNKREMLGSTGVGEGAAIPHTKIEGITKTIVLFLKL